MKKIKSNFQYVAIVALLLAMFASGFEHDVVFGELSGNSVGGNLVLNVTDAAAVDVYIDDVRQGELWEYGIASKDVNVVFYDGVAAGPVQVVSSVNTLASEHRNYRDSFAETLGYPDNQLTNDYWFTWYNYNSNVKTWLLISNPNDTTAEVDVYLGNSTTPDYHYSVGAKDVKVAYYDGIATGPVHVVSDINVFASEHRNYRDSFAETLGYPDNQLTNDYWFTWYNYNSNVKTWLLISNPNDTTAEVDVYLGKSTTPDYHYSVGAKDVKVAYYDGIATGPVHVVSDINVFASEHRNYRDSFAETLGYPDDQLTNNYWFTWYNYNSNVKTWLLISNPQ